MQYNILTEAKTKKQLIILIDSEKAFDKIQHHSWKNPDETINGRNIAQHNKDCI
jgi:hypothetical protein